MGYKIRCTRCKAIIIIKSGSLDKERKINCRCCGYENCIEKKKNGKIKIY